MPIVFLSKEDLLMMYIPFRNITEFIFIVCITIKPCKLLPKVSKSQYRKSNCFYKLGALCFEFVTVMFTAIIKILSVDTGESDFVKIV